MRPLDPDETMDSALSKPDHPGQNPKPEPQPGIPDVSVVVGAYNSMPYITTCVSSVLGQSIGEGRLELIAVDDGSTDGTGAELDRIASSSSAMQVVHQENSGGPAGPRNVGIERARGRYIFFLDADDYLGQEALERMVAMADRNNSDVVVGRRVGVGGRRPAETMLRCNIDNADLYESGVWWTLSAQKLFRRSFIADLNLRFPDLPIGQDQPFGGMAYLRAKVISVLADYDCYYLVRRDDGGNNTSVQNKVQEALDSVEMMMDMVAANVEPGSKRDLLMERHFAVDLNTVCFARRFLAADAETRQGAVARAQALLEKYYNSRLAASIPAYARLKYALIERNDVERLTELVQAGSAGGRGKDIVESRRVYAAYPYFRDPEAGLPDEVFEVTDQLKVRHKVTSIRWSDGALRLDGHAFIHNVDTLDSDSRLLLRHTDGTEVTVPTRSTGSSHLTRRFGKGTYSYDRAGFTAALDPSTVADGGPLTDGRWQVWLAVVHQDLARHVKLSAPSAAARATTYLVTISNQPRVLTVSSTAEGELVLTVDKQENTSFIDIDEMRWAEGGTALSLAGEASAGTVTAILASENTEVERVTTHRPGSGRYQIDVPLSTAVQAHTTAEPKVWVLSLELANESGRCRAPAPTGTALTRRWWSRARQVHVAVNDRTAALEITVAAALPGTRALGAIRQRLRRRS